MTEEKFLIQMFSGNKHYMECKCIDEGGRPTVIILPIEGECQHCDECEDRETCEILCAVGVELGKCIVIRRPD